MGTKWTEEQYKKAQIRRENKQLILGTGAAIRERFNLEMGKESPRPYLDAIIAGELVKIIMKRSALWEREQTGNWQTLETIIWGIYYRKFQ